MRSFRDEVICIVKSIPKGKVLSYGAVASMAGSPRAARQVGFILRQADPGTLPWWRVVNSKGQISIKGNFEASKQLQKELLEAEGVAINENFMLQNFIKVLWHLKTNP